MDKKRRKKILRFVSGRVGSGTCTCCGFLKLITIRMKKVKLCLKCMLGIAELFNMSTASRTVKLKKRKRMPIAEFSKEEMREMGNGAVRVPLRHKKRLKSGSPRYVMDGGIPKRVGSVGKDSNFQWGESGSDAAARHFDERLAGEEAEWEE